MESAQSGAPELVKLLFADGAQAAWELRNSTLEKWAAAFEAWLELPARQGGRSQRRAKKRAWRDFLQAVHKSPWDLGQADVQAWIDALNNRGQAAKTIRAWKLYVASFYRFAGEVWHASLANPAAEVKRLPALPTRQSAYLAADEARALLDAIDRERSILAKRDYAFILGILRLGLKPDEWRQLRLKAEDAGQDAQDLYLSSSFILQPSSLISRTPPRANPNTTSRAPGRSAG